MHTAINAASKLVETASREPFGILSTELTSSIPKPGPTNRSNSAESGSSQPSMAGGTTPEAISAALSSPR
ncbi:MAG: hypothetical protein BWY82_02766 [Verrucomicrobia bacterium ADurb.Bin474]|nr:MAG: hypothetical protein BWY82_02766 [Verrucomicrobia bacterium ADurb.Bin474]